MGHPVPLLVVFGGLPGTGKTTVARPVAERRRGAFVRIDEVEAAMWRARADAWESWRSGAIR
jgi:predicted kinase